MLDVLLNVIVFLFCFFLNGVFGQQSWRNAFLGSEAHAFQHFGLAHYAAVTVRELAEGFIVIPLQAGQPGADTEEGVGKACNLLIKDGAALDDGLHFHYLVLLLPKVEREAQGANQVGGAQ